MPVACNVKMTLHWVFCEYKGASEDGRDEKEENCDCSWT